MATTSGRSRRAWATSCVHRAVGPERHHLEPLRAGLDDLDGLGPDGAGRSDQADRDRPDGPGPGSTSGPGTGEPAGRARWPWLHPPSLPEIQAMFRARTR